MFKKIKFLFLGLLWQENISCLAGERNVTLYQINRKIISLLPCYRNFLIKEIDEKKEKTYKYLSLERKMLQEKRDKENFFSFTRGFSLTKKGNSELSYPKGRKIYLSKIIPSDMSISNIYKKDREIRLTCNDSELSAQIECFKNLTWIISVLEKSEQMIFASRDEEVKAEKPYSFF